MSFLPPVVMEIRANAAQFLSEQGKVVASAKATASETEKAAQKEAAAARASAAEATRAAEQRVAAAETSAKAATAATDRRIAAEARATAEQAKATEMQAALTEESAAAQKAAYEAQAAAAQKAASAVEVAAARENEAQVKATQATEAASAAQSKAADLQVVAAEKTAAAQEVAATRSSVAMKSVVSMANKVSAVSILAGAGVAVAATEMAAKFEKSTMLLVTAGGESMSALNDVRKGLLDISTQTGTSAEQMSEGMYVMEKAGIRGAAGLNALKMAAEGAKDENVDLGIMTQALTDLLLDYGTNTKDAAAVTRDSVKYTNELVAASGAAKTTMTDFAGSMAAVVPIASTAKISFDQVGGAIATMTQHGQTAQQSSQNLANLIMSLVRPNNLASAAMQQFGIDTTDLAQHLGERGLSGSLAIVDKAIKDHMQGDLVFQGSMKDNKSAVNDLNVAISKMPAPLADAAKGLLTGAESQKSFQKAAKDAGGAAGAVADQFLSLYKSTYGMSDNFKAGKPAAETYAAALRDVLGNVTAMRAAQMLLMNNSREFTDNIKAIGDAGKKTGSDIATWADMQETLSVKMDQTKAMVSNLGIEMGTKLLPVAKDLVGGFTDLFHGFEQGNPVLLATAAVIGGALTISAVNFGIQMGKTVVKTVSGLVDMGATAIAQSALFVSGMTADEVAVGQFSSKAEIAGAKVKGMGGLLLGAVTGATAVAAAVAVMAANTVHATEDVDKINKALTDFAEAGNAAGKNELDTMFSNWDTMFGQSTSDIKGLDDALQRVTHPNGIQQAATMFDGFAASIGLAKTSLGQADDKLKAVGDQLGKMAESDITKAQSAFQQLAKHTDGSKESLQKLLDQMPGYKSALQSQVDATGVTISQQELLEFAYGKIPDAMLKAMTATQKYTNAAGEVKPITPELQKSLDAAGVSADGLAADLEKLLTGMEQAGLTTLSTRDAQFKFADAVQTADQKAKDLKDSLGGDLSTALDQTGTDFNKTTAAGKMAEDQFAAVTRAGFAQADSMAKTGASHDALQNTLTDTYNKMVQTAEGFGMGDDQAKALARSVLNIPAKADITTWMDDYARQEAEKLKGAVDAIPSHKEIDILVSRRTAAGTAALDDAQNGGPGAFTGGAVASIMGFADGGLIPGTPPARPNVDNILAMVDGRPLKVRSGEFINNEPSTRMNLPWLKASNAGLNIGQTMRDRFTTGYQLGQQAQPAMAGAPASNTNINITAQTNATADHIASEVAWALRTQ